MASDRELAIKVRAVVDDFVNPMRTATTEVKTFASTTVDQFEKVEQSAERIRAVWKSMFEAFVGFEIFKGLEGLALQASRAANALDIAQNSAKNLGRSLDAKGIEEQLKGLAMSARGGGFAIGDMRDSIQQFAAVGASGSQAMRLLGVAIDLAAARHMALAEATHIVTMAASGHVEMLSRYGINVKDAEGKTVDFTTAIERMEKAFSGDAEKRANSLEGALGRLATTVSLLAEKIGTQLEPFFMSAANALDNFLQLALKIPTPVLAIGTGLTLVIGSLTAVGLLLPIVAKAFEFLGEGVAIARAILMTFYALMIGNVISGLRELVTWVSLARDAFAGMAVAEWLAEAPILAIVGAVTALVAIIVEAVRGFQDLKKVWDFLANLFHATLSPKITIPKVPLTGLGGTQTSDSSEWLKAQLAAVDQFLAHYQLGVERAQSQFALATSKKDAFSESLPPNEYRTLEEARQEESLITGELRAQQAVREALQQQRNAELQAAQRYKDLEKRVPAGADHNAQVAELEKKFNDAHLAAERITAELNKMGAAGAKAANAIKAAFLGAFKDVGEQMAVGIRAGFAAAKNEVESHIIAIQQRQRVRNIGGNDQNSGVDNAQDQLSIANLRTAEALNAYNEELKLWEDNAGAREEMGKKELDAETAAHNAKIAELDLEIQRADDEVRYQRQLLQHEQDVRAARDRTQLLQGTVGKIPGVGVSDTGALSFNWITVLIQAISETQWFAQVMNVTKEIVRTFAGILNALTPIIDLLLRGVIGVVNIFIDLWNIVARLLQLFGLHIALLQQLNYDLNSLGQTALIVMTHDIPTLTELATGNIAPIVAPGGNGQTTLAGLIQTQTNDQSGWFGSLLGDFVLLLGIDWLTGGKFFSSMGGFVSQLGSILQNVWNSIQQGFANLPSGMQAALQIGAGFALLDNDNKGVLGWLEKILGALLVISGLMQAFTGSGLFGGSGLLGLFTSSTGNNTGGILGNLLGNAGGSGTSTFTVDPSTGLVVDQAGNVVGTAGGVAGVGAFNDIVGVPGIDSIPGLGLDGIGNGLALPGDLGAGLDIPIDSGFGTIDSIPNVALPGGLGGAAGAGLSLTGALSGAGIGSLVGGLVSNLFPGQNDAGIGGTLGGAAAGAFGTAISAALGISTGGLGFLVAPLIGSLLGSGIGGLFGSHTSPATSPDIYNTQQFGQIIADLRGSGTPANEIGGGGGRPFSANGTQFSSNISNITGQNTSGVGYVEELLSQYAVPGTTTMGSNTPAWLQPLWSQLVSAFGISSTGSGWLNLGHNVGQDWVSGAQGASSSEQSYQTFGNLLQQVLDGVSQNGGGLGSASTQISGFANGLNTATIAISNMVDNLNAATSGLSNGLAMPTNRLAGAWSSGSSIGSGATQVQIIMNGDVNNATDLDNFYNNLATRTQYAIIAARTQFDSTSPPI